MAASGSAALRSQVSGAMSSGSHAINAGSSSAYSAGSNMPTASTLGQHGSSNPSSGMMGGSSFAIGLTLLALLLAGLAYFYNTPRNREVAQNYAQQTKEVAQEKARQ
ncbi:hypothetical protein LTR53_019801, partial [Teratosphaeriaceae sp. CCFEE 6253]